MATKRLRPAEFALPEGADDFKSISGIGPVVERRLHHAGILTYSQLAAASPATIFGHLADLSGMSVERIAQQDWVGKAATLAHAATNAEPHTPLSRQPYATFTVELLLSDANAVRRTRLVHIQSGQETSWAGWDANHLNTAILAQAGLAPAEVPAETPAPAEALPEPPAPDNAPESPEPPPISIIKKVEAMVVGSREPVNFLRSGLSYNVAITLESEHAASLPGPGEVIITANARHLNSGKRHPLGVVRTRIDTQHETTVTLFGWPLAPGTYRLEASAASKTQPLAPGNVFRGSLLQIL